MLVVLRKLQPAGLASAGRAGVGTRKNELCFCPLNRGLRFSLNMSRAEIALRDWLGLGLAGPSQFLQALRASPPLVLLKRHCADRAAELPSGKKEDRWLTS